MAQPAGDQGADSMADVFISYSRRDIAFARLIRESLQKAQVDTWIDWERIPIGQRWRDEIDEAIENANVFMFIVSGDSIGSSICKDEIHQAQRNHKRIVPILIDPITPDAVREFVPELVEINWIIFEKDRTFRIEERPATNPVEQEESQVASPNLPQFEEALGKLSQAIHTDWEWVKYHTSLQVDALRWEHHQRDQSYLLRDAALREAERWLQGPARKDPSPTNLQDEFVRSSRAKMLGDAARWYVTEEDVSHYAPDSDLTCINCSSDYTFTPSEHLPIPPSCPACGFEGKGRFNR
jgi:hypothetical protein